jgi:hypothetical protein
MASANTNKTVFALGIVAVIGYLAYKLWPAIRKAINSSSGGGGGGVGPGSIAGGGGDPYSSQQGGGPQIGASVGSGSGSGSGAGLPAGNGGALSAAVSQFLANFIGQGSYANSTPAQQEYIQGLADQPAESTDAYGIPTVALQNFDVNELATDLPSTEVSSYGTDSDYSPYLDTTSYAPGADDTYISDNDSGSGQSQAYSDYTEDDDEGD